MLEHLFRREFTLGYHPFWSGAIFVEIPLLANYYGRKSIHYYFSHTNSGKYSENIEGKRKKIR
jgi:hypothetical protein